MLFDRTLKENLLLGNPLASARELHWALEIAEMKELLRRVPRGWDTPVGPRGNALSGGERQRVALARAVLQNPSILLLDESTSALDAPSERQIFMNLAQHFPKQTIVFVSHRIASLKWVDRIIVLNRGVIEEQGSHDRLSSPNPHLDFTRNDPAHAVCINDAQITVTQGEFYGFRRTCLQVNALKSRQRANRCALSARVREVNLNHFVARNFSGVRDARGY